MRIIIFLVALLCFSSSTTIRASNNECSKANSERFNSTVVRKANSFDEFSIFEKFPRFLPSDSLDRMKLQLQKTGLGFGDIEVTCSNKDSIFFVINADDESSLWSGVEGFYRLKNNKYFSGPFTLKDLTVVIQVDPRSEIHKKR
jgi:hypothetical protein